MRRRRYAKPASAVTVVTERLTIKRVLEGRMGCDLTPSFEVYVDDELVGFSSRKWIALGIGRAIEAGHIERTGDTTSRYIGWLAKNDRATFDRLPQSIC
jgi:hypothetical protein